MFQIVVLLLGFIAPAAHAIVLEPVLHAAENMGYEVVGDLEFLRNSSRPTERQLRENLREVHALCPRDEAVDTHFVILAWSDREFPGERQAAYSSQQNELAAQRAQAVEVLLRQHIKGRTSFEHVNMANRLPQTVRAGSHSRRSPSTEDVKSVLKQAGAAPSSALEVGLFGEYGQHSKAVIWIDCNGPSSTPKRLSSGTPFQLAQGGANLNIP